MSSSNERKPRLDSPVDHPLWSASIEATVRDKSQRAFAQLQAAALADPQVAALNGAAANHYNIDDSILETAIVNKDLGKTAFSVIRPFFNVGTATHTFTSRGRKCWDALTAWCINTEALHRGQLRDLLRNVRLQSYSNMSDFAQAVISLHQDLLACTPPGELPPAESQILDDLLIALPAQFATMATLIRSWPANRKTLFEAFTYLKTEATAHSTGNAAHSAPTPSHGAATALLSSGSGSSDENSALFQLIARALVANGNSFVPQNASRPQRPREARTPRSPADQALFKRCVEGKYCFNFIKNKCTKGDKCKFNHSPLPSAHLSQANAFLANAFPNFNGTFLCAIDSSNVLPREPFAFEPFELLPIEHHMPITFVLPFAPITFPFVDGDGNGDGDGDSSNVLPRGPFTFDREPYQPLMLPHHTQQILPRYEQLIEPMPLPITPAVITPAVITPAFVPMLAPATTSREAATNAGLTLLGPNGDSHVDHFGCCFPMAMTMPSDLCAENLPAYVQQKQNLSDDLRYRVSGEGVRRGPTGTLRSAPDLPLHMAYGGSPEEFTAGNTALFRRGIYFGTPFVQLAGEVQDVDIVIKVLDAAGHHIVNEQRYCLPVAPGDLPRETIYLMLWTERYERLKSPIDRDLRASDVPVDNKFEDGDASDNDFDDHDWSMCDEDLDAYDSGTGDFNDYTDWYACDGDDDVQDGVANDDEFSASDVASQIQLAQKYPILSTNEIEHIWSDGLQLGVDPIALNPHNFGDDDCNSCNGAGNVQEDTDWASATFELFGDDAKEEATSIPPVARRPATQYTAAEIERRCIKLTKLDLVSACWRPDAAFECCCCAFGKYHRERPAKPRRLIVAHFEMENWLDQRMQYICTSDPPVDGKFGVALKDTAFFYKPVQPQASTTPVDHVATSLISSTTLPSHTALVTGDHNLAWVLDTGCTAPILAQRHLFDLVSHFVPTPGATVMMNSHPDPILGHGVLRFRLACDDGTHADLETRVLLCPTSEWNLLPPSIQGIDSAVVASQVFTLRIGTTSVTVPRKGGLFLLNSTVLVPSSLHTALPATELQNKGSPVYTVTPAVHPAAVVVHNALGHLGITSMHRLIREGYIKVLDPATRTAILAVSDLRCQHCPAASLPTAPIGPGHAADGNVAGLWSTDLCIINSPSLGGAVVMSAWLCHSNGWVELGFHKAKSHVFDWFVANRPALELRAGEAVSALRSDGGGEYVNGNFNDYCNQHHIVRQFTSPGSSFQNGRVERHFRTLRSRAGASLSQSGLPATFWAEAMSLANYVLNRLPRALALSPYQIVHGAPPLLSFVHPFGCLAYAHIDTPAKSTLTGRARPALYLGPAIGTKDGHKLLHLDTRRLAVNRTCKIIDDVFPLNPSGKPSTVTLLDLPPATSPAVATPLAPVQPSVDAPSPSVDAPSLVSPVVAPVASVVQPADVGPVVADVIALAPPADNGRPKRLVSRPANFDPGAYDAQRHFDLSNHAQVARHSTTSDPVTMHSALVARHSGTSDPVTMRAALLTPERAQWLAALNNELDAHVTNGTWKACTLPADRVAIPARYVFRVKLDADGNIDKYKVRLVAKGFAQRDGIDYSATFAPTLRMTTFRTLCAIACQLSFSLTQYDCVNAFLVPELEEELYLRLPEADLVNLHLPQHAVKNPVVRLVKTLYGLKNSPRYWSRHLFNTLRSMQFEQSTADPCLWLRIVDGSLAAAIACFVDDACVAARACDLPQIEAALKGVYKMTGGGPLSWFLGIKVNYNLSAGVLSLSQAPAILRTLREMQMDGSAPVATPAEGVAQLQMTQLQEPASQEELTFMAGKPYAHLVCTLLYYMLTRPDITFAVNRLTRYLSAPRRVHWVAALRVLKYLNGTREFGLQYRREEEHSPRAVGFSDADWAGDINSRRSTTGFVFTLCGAAISWRTKLQSSVALSTCEAELMALSATMQEAIWIRRLLTDLHFPGHELPMALKEDNQGALALVRDHRFSERCKHMAIRYFFAREQIEQGNFTVDYCPTADMLADIFTKALPRVVFQRLRDLLGMKDLAAD
jgi:hypothetical protein